MRNSKIYHILRATYRELKGISKAERDFPKGRMSYSQCGEDILIAYIFDLRGIHSPSYIDIGAHHPTSLSNTALFYYGRGSRGVNIEANPLLLDAFNTMRPDDKNVNIGISDSQSTLDFYVMENSTLSTFSKEECDKMVDFGRKLQEVKKIDTITLNDVIKNYCNGVFPDFMTLDVEGFDYKILQSIDYEKSCPKVICVEAAEYSPKGSGAPRLELVELLESKGYYQYASTNLNAIMVKKDFWFI